MKKVVLLTTGQPSTNPRIVKEADALHAAGFSVTVLYCYFIDWAVSSDEKLLISVPWVHKLIGGSPHKNKHIYFFYKTKI